MNFKNLTKAAGIAALLFASASALAIETINLIVQNNTDFDRDFTIEQLLKTNRNLSTVGDVKSRHEERFSNLVVDPKSTVFFFSDRKLTVVLAELTYAGGNVSAKLTDYGELRLTTPAIPVTDNTLNLFITIKGNRINSFKGSTIRLEEEEKMINPRLLERLHREPGEKALQELLKMKK